MLTRSQGHHDAMLKTATKSPTLPSQAAQATQTPPQAQKFNATKAIAKLRHPKIVRKPPLSRRDVAKAVAAALKLSDNKARAAVDAVLEAVKKLVQQGHAVELRGFCSFEVLNVKARSRVDMRDVKAGKKGAAVGRIVVPAHAVVKATASPVFLGGKCK